MIAALIALLAVVNSPVNSVTYACDGVTAAYTVNFPYLASSDLIVTSVTAGGVVTTLTQGTDYSLNLSSTSSTAALTLNSPATKCPSGSTFKIARNTGPTQPTSFRQQNNYDPRIHETAYDRVTMLIQEGLKGVNAPLSGAGNVLSPLLMSQANATHSGFLSAADWSAFSAGPVGSNTYTAPFTGAVSRLVSNKLADTISIRDFASCDGGTNDGPAISTWITNQGVTPTTLLVPSVTCLTNTSLVFPVTIRVKLEGNGRFTGSGSITYNGDLHEAHHVYMTDTPASAPAGIVELLHNSTTATSYALDIKDFADNPAAPTPGAGGAGAVAIHQYSDRGPAIVQVDNTRSQSAIIIRNTHNEFFATGNGGTGHFIDFVGYAAGTPYSPNGGLGTDPVFLGQLEGGLPGTPLTFASKNAATPWQFRSDTSAPSLKIVGGGTGIGLQISQAVAASALSISQGNAATAVNISGDVNTNGFFPMLVTGWSHGPKFTTSINSGPVLTIDQEVAGGNQVVFLVNKGAGLSIRVNNGTIDTFTVDLNGNIKVSGHSIDYGTAAPVASAWLVGDRRYNSVPAVGQPKSWVCTVAGTPGTWVSEGNL